MRKFIDVDGFEWLPCLDGTYVAVDGDGYHNPVSLEKIRNLYGPLTEVCQP